ncbi:MAG: YggS family pyridoxal phosphate-dependent enzyme [Bacteroidales bacterium]|mgnify:CR=1 FL=1|nr:YggS family pyridoxal phosphate-dependent enzyme [Bacteroidales bacterium]
MSIADEVRRIASELPSGVKLVAVSKFHPVEKLMQAYDAGQRLFGESRVQELAQKVGAMPSDVQWHFIGHLQTNKVRQLVPHVHLIHSVDSLKLLQCINKEAARIDRVVDVLLQVHVAQEVEKFGFAIDELEALANEGQLAAMPNVRVVGLMAMATNTDDEAEIRKEFAEAHRAFEYLKQGCYRNNAEFCELSMGMSDDYHLAIAEGSTMVRIGTTIFGIREY